MSVAVLSALQPHLLFTANTPAGGDMGAHVLAPAVLRDSLLPAGRIMGWSNAWYAGFPIFYFYFPLPSITIVLLDLLLPYGVAFKLVTVVGLVAMPPASYFLARSLGAPRPIAAFAGAAGGLFVFVEAYSIYGANIASTLAGEFAYSWSFALSLVYMGLLAKTLLVDRRYAKWAAVALALTALSHVLTALVVAFASLFVLTWRRSASPAVRVGAWGFALAGFWALPLAVRIGLTADMAWTPLKSWKELLPVELWPLVIPALIGVYLALRRLRGASLPLITTLVPLGYFWLPVMLPRYFPEFFPASWKLWNGRLLPYWYFGVFFFAGLAVGWGAVALQRRLPSKWPLWAPATGIGLVFLSAIALEHDLSDDVLWVLAGAALLVAAVAGISAGAGRTVEVSAAGASVVLGAGLWLTAIVVGLSFVSGWARYNYTGYEGKDAFGEYRSLMETVDALPPGRIQWEANSPEMERYGTPLALMLFPYWSQGHDSMEGLFFESSLTTPFHFLNTAEVSQRPSNPIHGLHYHGFDLDRGVAHMQQYGVRYYVTFTDEARTAAMGRDDMSFVASSDPFWIFELAEVSLVDVATTQPSVYRPEGPSQEFGFFALDWYDDPENLDRWVVESGPRSWPRVAGLEELSAAAVRLDAFGSVGDVFIEDHRIAFTTTAVGVPHLVKVSYFPNWKATGADGPYRSTPSLMVVVPTAEEVILEFERTWPETTGLAMSVVAWGTLGWSIGRRRWSNTSSRS